MAHHFRLRQENERTRRARSDSTFVPDPSDFTGDTAALGRPRRNVKTSDFLAKGHVSWEKALEDFSENELFWAELPNLPVNQSRGQASSSMPSRIPRKAPLSNSAQSRSQEPNVSEVDSVIGDANYIDDDSDIDMSEGQGMEQVPEGNIGIAGQYRVPTVPMFAPNELRGVHTPQHTRNNREEQARRAFPGLWRQTDQDWLNERVSDFFAELEDNDIVSTDKEKELGYKAIRWLAKRQRLIS